MDGSVNDRKPALWTIIVRCCWCRGMVPLIVPYGTAKTNFLCAVCDAKVSRWICRQMRWRQ